MNNNNNNNIDEYLQQLSDTELIVLNIAKTHLQSSFDLKKSIGFIEWLKKKTNDSS